MNVIQSKNGHIFICNAEADVDGKIYYECGSGVSLEDAREKASQNLMALLEKETYPCQENRENVQDKNRFKGGGNKPSSSAQQNLLHELAVTLGIQLGEFIFDNFHKSIPDLLGYEADRAIKSLKAQIDGQK